MSHIKNKKNVTLLLEISGFVMKNHMKFHVNAT